MSFFSVSGLVPLLQMAIGPVILISGIGLLLITMTNRLGRAIDQARNLSHLLHTSQDTLHNERAQLRVLWKRARLLRVSITLASLSALCAALLVISLFLFELFHLESALLIAVLFTICMLLLIVSLMLFIRDVNKSLAALKLEIQEEE